MSEKLTPERADSLLAEWFPDALAETDPDWWREMIEAMLEAGSQERAVEFLRTGWIP